MSKTVQAARLSLGHAPKTWHVVIGLPGLYHPDKPVPADERVKKAAKEKGVPLEIVSVPADEAKAAADELASAVEASRSAVLSTRREGADVDRVKDEAAAISGEKE